MKIFAVSDIHSFYTPMKEALDKAGFESGNEQQLLVICGDCFDRGNESQQVLDYLMNVPNKVLVKGNHESLFEEFCQRRYPMSHDWSNGTAKTIMDLAPEAKNWDVACMVAIEKMKPLLDQMVDYYETENYIFVHSFVALKCNDNYPVYYTRNRKFEYDPDWRTAHASAWETARWGNPLDLAMKGLNKTGKTIIAGHWHCSTGWAMEAGIPEFGYGSCFEPYYYKDELIMIDACTAYTHKVNILVIEDNLI
jgi:predicted MPP superfamily phosphohydrolase